MTEALEKANYHMSVKREESRESWIGYTVESRRSRDFSECLTAMMGKVETGND